MCYQLCSPYGPQQNWKSYHSKYLDDKDDYHKQESSCKVSWLDQKLKTADDFFLVRTSFLGKHNIVYATCGTTTERVTKCFFLGCILTWPIPLHCNEAVCLYLGKCVNRLTWNKCSGCGLMFLMTQMTDEAVISEACDVDGRWSSMGEARSRMTASWCSCHQH